MKKKSKFLISDSKNLYGHILDAQSAKIAKTPLLGVVLAILSMIYRIFMKKESKFLISDPKNLYGHILDAKSMKTPFSEVVRGEILIIYEKEVEILDQRPKNLYGANLSAQSANM